MYKMKNLLQNSLVALLAIGTIGCPIKSAEEARRDCEKFGKTPEQIIAEHYKCQDGLDKFKEGSTEWYRGFDQCILKLNDDVRQYGKACEGLTYTITIGSD